jgi:hypothetical protein
LAGVTASDAVGIIPELLKVAWGRTGSATIQQLALMLRTDRYKGESPMEAEVGILIVLEATRTVL